MNLIYKINEKPKTLKEWSLYTLQMLLSVFIATVLIANICGTPISSCLLGAGIATIIYELIISSISSYLQGDSVMQFSITIGLSSFCPTL